MVPAMNITSPSRGYRQPIIEISTNQKQGIAGPFPTWASPKSSPFQNSQGNQPPFSNLVIREMGG